MSKYNLTKYEQEVVINFNAGEDAADLYTANPVWIRKMDKLTEQNPEQFKLIRVDKCQGGCGCKALYIPKEVYLYQVKGRKKGTDRGAEDKISGTPEKDTLKSILWRNFP